MRAHYSLALILAVAASVAVEAADFKWTWKAPDTYTIGFAGKKVAAMVISQDQMLRMSAEEALVRQLNTLGIQGVAAYKLIPREELQDAAKAKVWIEKAQLEGVVAMRLVSAETLRTYSPASWSSTSYSSLWSYYDTTWVAVYNPGYLHDDRVVTVETVLFSVPKDKLLWGGLSESTNPKTMDAFMKDLVTKAVKEMKKQGFMAAERN
jgi:hypothetical protein